MFFWSCSNDPQKDTPINRETTTTTIYQDSLNKILEREFNLGHLPGFVSSVFTKDSIYFMKGYGFSTISNKKPYTQNTIQGVASISKTLIGVALMKAVEDKMLTLDDEINAILPFQVTNPNYPKIPITLRQLATHTSSILDDGNYDKAYIFSEKLDANKFSPAWEKYIKIYNKNKSMPMEDFLNKVFTEWKTEKNFSSEKPGTSYEYSNIGAALLAYCIELKTGKNYKNLTEDLILKPLKMNNSGWNYQDLNQENHITYYNEDYNPVPNYQIITYPDGGLFTTASDLTIYMQEIIKGHQGEGKLLKPLSYTKMMENQIPRLEPANGIIWDLSFPCCIGHGGNDFGIASLAYFNPKTGIGKILLTNISTEKEEQGDQFYEIFNSMFKLDSMIIKG